MAAQASAKKARSTPSARPDKPAPRAAADELHGDRSDREAACPSETAAWLRSDVWPTAKKVPARAGADDEISSVRPRPLPPGQRVLAERYVLIRPLVSGESDLWLADHRARGRMVVIRLGARGLLADAAARDRFRRQASAAERVRSPHLVELYDHGIDASSPFSVMQLLEGEDLAHRLKRLGKLNAPKTAEVVAQVARALARVHASRALVGDLRASKVFFQSAGADAETIKLLPAADIDAELRSGLAPELRTGKACDHRADLWSLGALAWHCLTGRELVAGEIPPPASQIAPELCAFDDWFARALAGDPGERFSSARAMSEAFAEAAAAQASGAARLAGASPAAKRSSSIAPTGFKSSLPPPPPPRVPVRTSVFPLPAPTPIERETSPSDDGRAGEEAPRALDPTETAPEVAAAPVATPAPEVTPSPEVVDDAEDDLNVYIDEGPGSIRFTLPPASELPPSELPPTVREPSVRRAAVTEPKPAAARRPAAPARAALVVTAPRRRAWRLVSPQAALAAVVVGTLVGVGLGYGISRATRTSSPATAVVEAAVPSNEPRPVQPVSVPVSIEASGYVGPAEEPAPAPQPAKPAAERAPADPWIVIPNADR